MLLLFNHFFKEYKQFFIAYTPGFECDIYISYAQQIVKSFFFSKIVYNGNIGTKEDPKINFKTDSNHFIENNENGDWLPVIN